MPSPTFSESDFSGIRCFCLAIDSLSLLLTLTSMPSSHRHLSAHSLCSSVESLALFPRPLTVRRTITSQPPLVSPTPLGRHWEDGGVPSDSLRRGFVDIRPVTRGKSPRSKRHTHMSSAVRRAAVPEAKTDSACQSLEGNSFTGQLGLARMGGNRRRSSIASLSTLKIPRSFRPSVSRGGSSLYSCDTKGTSLRPCQEMASECSVSSRRPRETSPTRVTSFDETIFKGLDWKPQDVDVRYDLFPILGLEGN